MSKNLTGMTFHRLTVIKHAGSKQGRVMWLCQCTCNKLTIVSGHDLLSGHTKSCGCLQRESYKHGIRHGLKNSKIYNNWKAMMERCYNKKHTSYKDYGGRGITVCKDWHNILNFYQWAMSNGYKDGLTIERKMAIMSQKIAFGSQ